jgi:hypothetical protein
MTTSAGAHQLLRREVAETPPDMSYRFVVSFATDLAARAAWHAATAKKAGWRRAAAFRLRRAVRLAWGVALMFFLFGLGAWIYDGLMSIQAPAIAGSVAVAVCLAGIIGFPALVIRRALARALARMRREFHAEFFADNVFLVEGRKSCLWYDERTVGAVRRWSTFARVVEFDDGLWLIVRRGRMFAGLSGFLISKEGLPGSCNWEEFKGYVNERIAEASKDPTGV